MSGIACLPHAKDTEPSAQKIRILMQSYDAKGLMRHLVEAFQEKLQVSSPGKLELRCLYTPSSAHASAF